MRDPRSTSLVLWSDHNRWHAVVAIRFAILADYVERQAHGNR